MKINEQDIFPEVSFYQIMKSGPEAIEASKILKNKKVLLVGVPGAFTPTCSDEHLPGYKKLASDFFSKGIEVLTNTNSYTIPYDGPSKSVFEKWLPFSKDK